MRSYRSKLPEVLEVDEAKSLLDITNKKYPTGGRNEAMLSVMLNIGLKVSEVSNLKHRDVSINKTKLRVVNGKNGKDRDLVIPGYTLELLEKLKVVKPESIYFFSALVGARVT